jgi:hypothetical protein
MAAVSLERLICALYIMAVRKKLAFPCNCLHNFLDFKGKAYAFNTGTQSRYRRRRRRHSARRLTGGAEALRLRREQGFSGP